MEKTYWDNYYNSNIAVSQPSLFAQFVLKEYVKERSSLLEIGCGNGRDAIFFALNNINVLAVDQCDREILLLSENNHLKNLKFNSDDFTNLGEIGFFDNIYSRLTLHSIKKDEEDRVIKWSFNHLNLNGKILIEARGLKNELFQLGEKVKGEENAFIYENHYRRFINIDGLRSKLENSGFTIISVEEKSGFAPFKETDYVFIRIIAVKK